MAGRERESDRREEKGSGRFVVAAKTRRELAEWRRFQRKNINILRLPKRKEWPQGHKVSSWQVHQSRLCQKEKEQSHLSRSSDRGAKENQDDREPHLGEKERNRRGSMGSKEWTLQ